MRKDRPRQSLHYCEQRSAEAKEEIARCHEEALVLKARLGLGRDEHEEGNFRKRRRFLSRRIDELKAELDHLSREASDVKDELVILLQETDSLKGHSSEVGYSLDTHEEHKRDGSLTASPILVVDNS